MELTTVEVDTLIKDTKNSPPVPEETIRLRLMRLFVRSNSSQLEVPNETNRLRWDSFIEYFLSIIGFVIDLGNVWRFPTVCYMNGGGAFLIPFFVCLFLIGMPCMYLELAIGQYFQQGNIGIWAQLSPYMKGIGYSVILINVLMLSYYNTLQAYALYFLINSFQVTLPWSSCDHPWNTKACKQIVNTSLGVNETQTSFYLGSSEYFRRKVLGMHLSTGFEDIGGVKWDLLACLFVIFVLTTLCLVKGIKTSGKAVYITALLPYICLAILIVKSMMLDGAFTGLKYYLKPDFSRLLEVQVWLAAALQIFFSLGPGFGVLITYASYTPKTTKIKNVTIACATVNCLTSLMYGLVVFSGLGYMAKRLNVEIEHFLQDGITKQKQRRVHLRLFVKIKYVLLFEGIGIVFIVYPEILATFKYASLFSIVFFVMLILLGMDSAFGGMEGLFTSIVDEFPFFKRHPLKTRLVISAIPFITALPTVSYGGIYVVQW